MKKSLSILFGALAWFAIISQYVISISSRQVTFAESTIRFFSYFTLLSNTIIALYFTYLAVRGNQAKPKLPDRPGFLTTLTVYIVIVAVVYHVTLRNTWEPKGFQKVVDLALHTIIPLCTLLFWFLYEGKTGIPWKTLPKCLIFPFVYWVLVMLRGAISGFYPYPFFNVPELGLTRVILNGIIILMFIALISFFLIGTGKLLKRNKTSDR